MAEIITAKSAGFCFGVQRAVETVYEEVKKGGPIYTYGPIIHNEEVVADLEKKGFSIAEETAKYKNGKLTAVYLKDAFGGFAVHLLQK